MLGPFHYTESTSVQENGVHRRHYSPPTEQILQSSHDVCIADEKTLFFAGGRLVYRVVLALKIIDGLRESSRGLVPGESQCLRQHRPDEIIRRAHRGWRIGLVVEREAVPVRL